MKRSTKATQAPGAQRVVERGRNRIWASSLAECSATAYAVAARRAADCEWGLEDALDGTELLGRGRGRAAE